MQVKEGKDPLKSNPWERARPTPNFTPAPVLILGGLVLKGLINGPKYRKLADSSPYMLFHCNLIFYGQIL